MKKILILITISIVSILGMTNEIFLTENMGEDTNTLIYTDNPTIFEPYLIKASKEKNKNKNLFKYGCDGIKYTGAVEETAISMLEETKEELRTMFEPLTKLNKLEAYIFTWAFSRCINSEFNCYVTGKTKVKGQEVKCVSNLVDNQLTKSIEEDSENIIQVNFGMSFGDMMGNAHTETKTNSDVSGIVKGIYDNFDNGQWDAITDCVFEERDETFKKIYNFFTKSYEFDLQIQGIVGGQCNYELVKEGEKLMSWNQLSDGALEELVADSINMVLSDEEVKGEEDPNNPGTYIEPTNSAAAINEMRKRIAHEQNQDYLEEENWEDEEYTGREEYKPTGDTFEKELEIKKVEEVEPETISFNSSTGKYEAQSVKTGQMVPIEVTRNNKLRGRGEAIAEKAFGASSMSEWKDSPEGKKAPSSKKQQPAYKHQIDNVLANGIIKSEIYNTEINTETIFDNNKEEEEAGMSNTEKKNIIKNKNNTKHLYSDIKLNGSGEIEASITKLGNDIKQINFFPIEIQKTMIKELFINIDSTDTLTIERGIQGEINNTSTNTRTSNKTNIDLYKLINAQKLELVLLEKNKISSPNENSLALNKIVFDNGDKFLYPNTTFTNMFLNIWKDKCIGGSLENQNISEEQVTELLKIITFYNYNYMPKIGLKGYINIIEEERKKENQIIYPISRILNTKLESQYNKWKQQEREAIVMMIKGLRCQKIEHIKLIKDIKTIRSNIGITKQEQNEQIAELLGVSTSVSTTLPDLQPCKTTKNIITNYESIENVDQKYYCLNGDINNNRDYLISYTNVNNQEQIKSNNHYLTKNKSKYLKQMNNLNFRNKEYTKYFKYMLKKEEKILLPIQETAIQIPLYNIKQTNKATRKFETIQKNIYARKIKRLIKKTRINMINQMSKQLKD